MPICHTSYVTCKRCKWVYFQVSREYIEAWKKQWAEFWPTLDEQGRNAYGVPCGPPTDDIYLRCHCGNSYKNFRRTRLIEFPCGSTIGPILNRKE